MVSALGVGLAVVAACCLAGQALTVRLASRQITAAHVLLVVLVVNALVFLPLAMVVPEHHGLTARSLLAFIAAGLVGTMLGRAFFYSGIKRIGAARAEPLKASMPLYATIFALLLLHEPVTPLQFLGVVLIVIGIGIVTWDGAARENRLTGAIDWGGLALPIMGAIMFAFEPIFATIGLQDGTPVLVGLAVKTVAAAVVFAAYLLLRTGLPRWEDVSVDFRWLLAAGAANSGFLLAYYAGLSVSRVAIVVPIMQTSPILVALASVFLLRGLERVTGLLLLGVAVVVAGAMMVTLFG